MPIRKIGVVTVTYNSAGVIDGFLRSVLQQGFRSFMLYVVDNASADETLPRVNSYEDAPIKVLANRDNVGIAAGNNQGAGAAVADGCDAILFLNNDTEFSEDLFSQLAAGLEEHQADMAAPKIVFFEQNLIWSAGGGFKSARGYAGFHHGYGEIDRGQFDSPRFVDHGPACCLLVRKSVFSSIGMMDERYFAYVDDTDFCYRARRAGLKLIYLPAATVQHKAHSLTGGLGSDFMMRYTTRNRVYFMLKHFGPARGLYYVPAYQFHLIWEFLSRSVGLSRFLLREKAFLEGLRLWKESVAR